MEFKDKADNILRSTAAHAISDYIKNNPMGGFEVAFAFEGINYHWEVKFRKEETRKDGFYVV